MCFDIFQNYDIKHAEFQRDYGAQVGEDDYTRYVRRWKNFRASIKFYFLGVQEELQKWGPDIQIGVDKLTNDLVMSLYKCSTSLVNISVKSAVHSGNISIHRFYQDQEEEFEPDLE